MNRRRAPRPSSSPTVHTLTVHSPFVQGAFIAYAYANASSLTPAALAVWVPVAYYLVFSYMDGTEYELGKPWERFQRWRRLHVIIGSGKRSWFKPRIVYDDEKALKAAETRGLKPDALGGERCIFACFPHGVVSFHHGVLMTDTAGFMTKFPTFVTERRDLVASITLAVPGYRELLMWLGCVDAGKRTAKKCLKANKHLYVLPGGEAEQMLTRRGEHRVFLKKRKGFVKLAIEHGSALVPVYAFGETDMYHTTDFLMRPRKALMKHLRIAIPLFWGAWGSPVPKPGTLAVVVGTPMRIKKVEPEAITRQLVDKTHAAFVDALRALFDKHKKQCGYPDAELEVF